MNHKKCKDKPKVKAQLAKPLKVKIEAGKGNTSRGRPKPGVATRTPAKSGTPQAKVNSSHKGQALGVGGYATSKMELFLIGHQHYIENLPRTEWRSQRYWSQLTGIPKSTIQRRWGMKDVKPHGGAGHSRVLTSQQEEALAERVSK